MFVYSRYKYWVHNVWHDLWSSFFLFLTYWDKNRVLNVRQMIYDHRSSFRTLFIHDTPTKFLKHFISRTFIFLLSALLIPHASVPHNAVNWIPLHVDTSSHLSPILYYSAKLSALPTLYTPHSFCVPHLCHNLHPLPLATPGT